MKKDFIGCGCRKIRDNCRIKGLSHNANKENQDLEQHLYEEEGKQSKEVISLQKKEIERLQKICVENIKNKQENEKEKENIGKPIQKIAGDTPFGFDSISSKPEIEDFSPKVINEKEIYEQKSENFWLLQLKKKRNPK